MYFGDKDYTTKNDKTLRTTMRIKMKISSDYTSNRAWLRDVVGNQPMILRSVSALEYLQLFVGYFSESKVEVYALEESPEENI